MILSRAHVLLKDDRKDLRIQERGEIPWRIKYKQREGKAKIRNMSVSGMLIETNSSFNKQDECVFSFDSDPESNIYIPRLGRLVWHKKKRFSRNKYLCGIKFLEAEDQILTRMRAKVHDGVERFIRQRRISAIAGSVLAMVIVVLIGSLVWFSSDIYKDLSAANDQMIGITGEQTLLSQNYNNLYRNNEMKLVEANRRLAIANQLIQDDKAALALYSQELEATRALLGQTESMLIQANDRNIEVSNELQALKTQTPGSGLALGEENITTIEQARMVLSSYRVKIRSIKGEIARLKEEDRLARQAELAQIDGWMLDIGNNGYFIKEGQKVEVDELQYMNLKANQVQGESAASDSNVAIDVTFYE